MPEPGIVLVGLPGTGKTTVGRCLADRLGRPFVDTDEVIARSSGSSVGELLQRLGEERFREREREAVREACAEPAAVIATGGGAVVDPLNRWDLRQHGARVWLDADAMLLVSRLASDGAARPLLGSEPATRLLQLMAEREPLYRASDIAVDAGRAIVPLAEEIAARFTAMTASGGRLYDAHPPRHHPQGPANGRVVLGHGLSEPELRLALADVAHGTSSVVIDPRGEALLARVRPALGRTRELRIPGGEAAKRMRRLERLLAWLAAERAERGEAVVAVGGGTIGDLAGMAAAVYARGVPLVQVPTTWLAMADSALGGKVGVDVGTAKNAAGAFWPSWAVIADTTALDTLPPRESRNGLAEAVKVALIGDPQLWRLLEERGSGALGGSDPAARYAITERAAVLKLAIVERDPYERGERRVLNLGHTIGHALESESGYRLPHGAAVALGLRAVAVIGAARAGEARLAEQLDALLVSLGFSLVHRFDDRRVLAAIGHDKKRAADRQCWILPVAIGQVVEVDDVTHVEVAAALTAIQAPATVV